MTARDFKDALGPLARQMARAAGFTDSAWDKAVYSSRELTPEERAGLDAALKEHQAVVRRVRKAL